MICSFIICAAQTLGVMTFSAHSGKGYESVTPGVYVVTPNGYAAGAYRNSHGNPAAFVGKQFETDRVTVVGAALSAAVLVGGVVGYGKPSPLLTPAVAATMADKTVRVTYIPKHPSKPSASDAMHLSLEWRLK